VQEHKNNQRPPLSFVAANIAKPDEYLYRLYIARTSSPWTAFLSVIVGIYLYSISRRGLRKTSPVFDMVSYCGV